MNGTEKFRVLQFLKNIVISTTASLYCDTIFAIKNNKEIAEYGPDGKRINSIHIIDHKGLGPHWHPWRNGGQVENVAHALTKEMKSLINKIINFKK